MGLSATPFPPVRIKNAFPPTDLREVVDTMFYPTHAGVQWDCLPNNLVPKSTTFDNSRRWSHGGTLQRIVDALRRDVPRAADYQRPC